MKWKDTKAAYFLLPVVLFIWGMVIYQIFFYGDENAHYESIVQLELDRIETVSEADTFSLYLDYPDPFLKRNRVVRKKSAPKKKKKPPKKEVKKKVKWPSVAYGGMIKNQNTDESLAMVNIQGKDRLMQEGEAVGLLQLEKIYADSIRVSYESHKRTILK